MASRNNVDNSSDRKRMRLGGGGTDSSSTSSSASSGLSQSLSQPILSISSKWDWTTTTSANAPLQSITTIATNHHHLHHHQQQHHHQLLRMQNNGSPSGASDSVSLSGSETGGSQKTSPSSTPIIVPTLRVTLPKIISGALIGRDTDSPSIGGGGLNSALNTPPVIGDLRPFLIRPSALAVDDQNTNGGPDGISIIGVSSTSVAGPSSGASIGVVAPWQLQDFGDGLAFDASLSGLSDLAGPVNDVMEFVKRQSSHPGNSMNDSYTFQYILMAPTSAAVKLHEEPLTYLNQGQSYEIKCKKLGMEGMMPGRLFRGIIRVTFHDRRQKFQERELLHQWKQMHLGDKIIDADVPMSYNIFNVKTDPMGNSIDFLWDPTKNTSIFIKVNCISTEFTLRKHGGEKGVPFRLQIDTYYYGDDVEPKHLHSSYAQVKVFKTKGADRKNKTDREKAEKHSDKEKYQPAYDYTILTETFPVDTYDEFDRQQQLQQNSDEIIEAVTADQPTLLTPKALVVPMNAAQQQMGGGMKQTSSTGAFSIAESDSGVIGHSVARSPSPLSAEERQRCVFDALSVDANPNETSDWLRRQRFPNHVKTFNNYSGSDLLRLSREDLIQICDSTADGIRLFNALQYKKIQPKLTLYMCVPGAPAYHAVFLVALTLHELVRKVCELIQVQPSQVFDVYCQGPDGINVHMNDDVVQNLPDRSRYVIDAMKCGDEQAERYRILLKAATEA